jgi:cobalt-zinc-cadmium efflux system membrane fusion protein
MSERIRIAVPFFELAAGTPKGDEPAITERKPGAEGTDNQQGVVKLSAEDIESAGIEVAPVKCGTISRRIIVPSTIVPHADRIARKSESNL